MDDLLTVNRGDKHKDRLDKSSVVTKLTTTDRKSYEAYNIAKVLLSWEYLLKAAYKKPM